MSTPRLLRVARQRLRAVFRRDALDAELDRELAFHLEQLVQEFVDDGLSLEEARHAARRAIGNIPSLEEACRDHRTVSWIHDLRQDAAYALRMLRRNPGFTLVAVLSLAIGIGANTAIVSVMGSVLRGSTVIPDEDRLVVLRTFPRDDPQQETHALLDDYFAWREESRSFDLVGVSLGNNADFGPEDGGMPPERIGGQSVTSEALSALGVQPMLGRLFAESDGQPGPSARVIIISHRLWERRFGSRPDIVGQEVRLDRVNRTIIGVMPRGFRHPNETADYWIPLSLDRSVANPQRFFVVTARLKESVTIRQAQDDLDIIAARLARESPDLHAGWGVRVKPLREAMLGWTVQPLVTLGAAVALVLLVACANLAGLQLARGIARTPEIAVRTALGAGRGRIVRQLLTESLLLSLVGGVLGVFVSWSGMRGLMAMRPPPGSVGIVDSGLDLGTLGVTALISIATGLVFGLAPALMSARAAVGKGLKEAPDGPGFGRHQRLRGVLVAAQIAVTLLLLVGSGLLLKSFVQIVSRDLHFDPERLLTFEFHLPMGDYMHRHGTAGGLAYFQLNPPPSQKLERVFHGLQALPGVESVAGISFPMVNSVVLPSMAIRVETPLSYRQVTVPGPAPSLAIGVGGAGTHVTGRGAPSAVYFLVTPGFFTSMRATLVRGRDIADGDRDSSPWVAIVNESAARLFWPGADPIGQRFRLPTVPDERPREVIGVVRDIPLTLRGSPAPAIYTSYLQQPGHYTMPGANMLGRMTFMLRSSTDGPMSLVPAVRRVVADIDPERPLANVVTMEQQLESTVPQRGMFVLTLTLFALTAMLLAAIGIYGVMAYSVARRTREIGVRLALGARAAEVAMLVGRHALWLVACGVTTGLAGALALTQLLRSQLWGVTPTDPGTFAAVIAMIGLVAIASCVFPLRRATRVDPTIALRCE